jgi:hypothetical protein
VSLDRNWDDAALYAFFDILPEEQTFIEQIVREMDLD